MRFGPSSRERACMRRRKRLWILLLLTWTRRSSSSRALAASASFGGMCSTNWGGRTKLRPPGKEAKGLYPTAARRFVLARSDRPLEGTGFLCSPTPTFRRHCCLLPMTTGAGWRGRILDGYPRKKMSVSRVIPELEIAKTIRPDLPFASELLCCPYSARPIHGYAVDPLRQKKELTDQIERFGLDILRAHAMSNLLQREKSLTRPKQFCARFWIRTQVASPLSDSETWSTGAKLRGGA